MKRRSRMQFEVEDWGRTRYVEAFERQLHYVEQRRSGQCEDCLVFTEHEPVYTLGKRRGAIDHLVWSTAQCQAAGIEVAASNRGGDVTYHGPGQIVVYPIFSLRQNRDLHRYLRMLESVVIASLAAFGLAATRRESKTGIWIETRKICAIGVAVRSWVTYHGLALNVNPNLSHFEGIVPCGIRDGTVTSIEQELGACPCRQEIQTTIAVEFDRVFADSAGSNE